MHRPDQLHCVNKPSECNADARHQILFANIFRLFLLPVMQLQVKVHWIGLHVE